MSTSQDKKIELIRSRCFRGYKIPEGHLHLPLTHALPFYRKALGLVHRVRSGIIFNQDGNYSHTSIHFWCGNVGFLGPKNDRRKRHGYGSLFAEPPENSIHCAHCEGKATGAGLNGARVIAGRAVLFSPRV